MFFHTFDVVDTMSISHSFEHIIFDKIKKSKEPLGSQKKNPDSFE